MNYDWNLGSKNAKEEIAIQSLRDQLHIKNMLQTNKKGKWVGNVHLLTALRWTRMVYLDT